MWVTNYFRPYLSGQKFRIFTDHRPLQWLLSFKEPNSKLFRWGLQLEELGYEIMYKKGKLNTNAGVLCHIPSNTETISGNLTISTNNPHSTGYQHYLENRHIISNNYEILEIKGNLFKNTSKACLTVLVKICKSLREQQKDLNKNSEYK